MRRLSEAMGEAGDVVSLSRTVEHEPVVGHPGFTAVERREFRNPQRFTRERLLGYVASTSAVAVMDEARRSATLARVAALCDWEPELRSGDGFTVPYVAGCVRAVRV